eukprot:8153356-Pyramimonas_sp.AAC.1
MGAAAEQAEAAEAAEYRGPEAAGVEEGAKETQAVTRAPGAEPGGQGLSPESAGDSRNSPLISRPSA